MPILPFSSVSGPLQNHSLKSKRNNMHNPNKYGNYWLLCEVMIFPERILKLICHFGELHLEDSNFI